MKPEFIDNRNGNTLSAALRGHLAWARETYREPLSLAIATGYFNPEGFAELAEQLEGLGRVRLLLGAEPAYPPRREIHLPGQPRGDRLQQQRLARALQEAEQGIRQDRNLLDFSARSHAAIEKLLAFLRTGKLEVRRYERGFLHGKAFVFSNGDGVIAGSSNFTAAGLLRNLELNLGHYQPGVVAQVQEWFEGLWAEAATYDLAALYEERLAEYEPYLIYLRVLWERYGHELEAEQDRFGNIKLTTFQTDGVSRAERILREFHGVLVADGVGLGKSFIAGEIVRRVRESRRRVLLVAPAALRDGPWATFVRRHDLGVDCVSFEELTRELDVSQGQSVLGIDIRDYAMIVVDEAHALRNPETDRARALRRLLEGTPPKDLVLLTATPVNNTLWDLYYLLAYFVAHDAAFADRGIPSLKTRFHDAVVKDPESLKPDVLFDVLDAVAVRRTRHFVKRYYPNERVPGPNGTEIVVTFPKPVVRRVSYDFDKALPGVFDEFAAALVPDDDGHVGLTMARFSPSRFRKDGGGEAIASEAALVGLIRSGLLKRFESSVHAFARTCGKLLASHELFLQALARGFVPTSDGIEAIEDAGDALDDDELAEILERTGSEPASAYDVEALRAAVEADRALLQRFQARAAAVRNEDDPKLDALVEALVQVLREAEHDAGADELQRRDCRKVLVFSYFADTVDWVERRLRDALAVDRRLAPYRGRIASVSGRQSRGEVSRDDAVFGFAPRSTEAPKGRTEDRFDILVTTDVLAEGMNLQQCRNIVNVDLPWNPMRLVQRHGRIDRIGSPHDQVFIRCFFPDAQLDALLALEARIRRKLTQAARSIGVESEVIPGGATGEVVFADESDQIKSLRDEDASLLEHGGEDARAHSGEEYRQELRKGIERYGRATIENLPWAAGSGFRTGARAGHFFCARVGDGTDARSFLRFVPADGSPIERDSLTCLRLIGCTSEILRDVSDDVARAAYPAWERARAHIFEEWQRSTDPANLQPKIPVALRRAAEHVRRHPPPGVSAEQIADVAAALEAPCGQRIVRQIRAIVEDPGLDNPTRSARLFERVHVLGLRPFTPPKPLPPIREEDVMLVCWMGTS